MNDRQNNIHKDFLARWLDDCTFELVSFVLLFAQFHTSFEHWAVNMEKLSPSDCAERAVAVTYRQPTFSDDLPQAKR